MLGGALASLAIGSAVKAGSDYLKGKVSNYFAEKRARDQAELEYAYAQRFAENSPSWNVAGLRNAGLNPILAASGGFTASNWKPSSPSTPDTNSGVGIESGGKYFDPLTLENYKLLKQQNKSLRLDNALKGDNLNTTKAENEVKRLKAEAEASILRPVRSGPLAGDDKEVSVLLPSKSFQSLQKAIADDYDLRSEKYLRETIDAVMRYGTDVLKLLPQYRRNEIMETIQRTTKTGPNGKKSSVETYTVHGPKK